MLYNTCLYLLVINNFMRRIHVRELMCGDTAQGGLGQWRSGLAGARQAGRARLPAQLRRHASS